MGQPTFKVGLSPSTSPLYKHPDRLCFHGDSKSSQMNNEDEQDLKLVVWVY